MDFNLNLFIYLKKKLLLLVVLKLGNKLNKETYLFKLKKIGYK